VVFDEFLGEAVFGDAERKRTLNNVKTAGVWE
jgi:hypothetical protein